MEGHEEGSLYTTTKGEEIYSTEKLTTEEEKKRLLEKKKDYDHAYALYLSGKGPNPDEKKEVVKDNITKFPKIKIKEEKKAA